MADDEKMYQLLSSSGWTFHSVEDIVACDPDAGSNGDEENESMAERLSIDALSSSPPPTTTATTLSNLISEFDTDGFLALSSLLSPQFITQLRRECMDIFQGVLDWLLIKGEVEFSASYRRREYGVDEVEAQEKEEGTSKYQYPLGVGLKNGYTELVMRSPGRYEMALLLDDLPIGGMGGDAAATTPDYEGKWLLSAEMLKRMMEKKKKNVKKANTHPREQNGEEESCLKQLLEWAKKGSRSDGTNGNGLQSDIYNNHHQQYPADQKNMERFMKLVGAVFSPPSSTSSTGDGDCSSSNNNNNQNSISTNINTNPKQDEYYICNLSLLVATPGCPTQSWHADGGHTSLTTHEKCHVFNVFIPLVDVPLTLGPTEIRPGTHFHTRNLAPMMLAAKARKTLRAPVTPQLRRGDALLFDYRILHRGRANVSDEVGASASGLDMTTSNDEDREVDRFDWDGVEDCGRYRPVLVMTFARRWFVDVCNFPKRSIFALDETK